jgi:hypothetical protein
MPLFPGLWRQKQRQADFCVLDQPGLQSEFQISQGYTETPCLEKQTKQYIYISLTLIYIYREREIK